MYPQRIEEASGAEKEKLQQQHLLHKLQAQREYNTSLEFTTIAKIVNTEFGNNEFCLLDGDYMSSCHYPKLVHQPNDFYYRNGLAIKPINDCGNCY